MMPSSAPPRRLTTWPAGRRALAAAAMACAVVTGAFGALLAPGTVAVPLAIAHALVGLWVLVDRRVLALQVAVGVALAWSLVPDDAGTVLAVVPVVSGVVATSELLGATDRLGMVLERHPGPELARVGTAVGLAVATSGATLAAGALAGPAGLLATAVAALGCTLLAVALRAPAVRAPGQR